MAATKYQAIKDSLRRLYLDDPRPWLVGFSGGKDSTLVASLIVETVVGIPEAGRKKPVSILCTDTRVEIPAIAETIEATLSRIRRFSQQNNLNIEVNLLRPPPEQSFWVNIIGRGYPPPNRVFRWCTQRLKIDPVTMFVQQRLGHWSEAILHLGARRAESSTRAQTMAGREKRNGLNRHPDLPRVWVSNPIEFLTTEEVWAYLLQRPNPWGGNNRALYKLYASASNGECPIQIDTSTPSCGNSRFGCWTCTVVERDKASEGLLASGDERMEQLIEFRETLLHYQDPANGKRDPKTKQGADRPGPLTIEARRELLTKLLQLQEQVGLPLITDDELFFIQQLWKSARRPDDGGGVARIVTRQKGILMSDWKETNRLRELQEEVAAEKGIRAETLRRLLAKVDEYSESHRAFGLPDELLAILKDDLEHEQAEGKKNV
ncbi:MAG TPA: DNA phosphorothioation system sulfurtransferase DndC [Verrucomicrobiota bacterium]|nr:DNA phosphorothioation system sulfurtransferase DndC [Verrucomicrobiota bacterium]HQB17437.1 DNA phosphorothioation system sulfurtransferase DndC [Verrucomicrobiota bacterium]